MKGSESCTNLFCHVSGRKEAGCHVSGRKEAGCHVSGRKLVVMSLDLVVMSLDLVVMSLEGSWLSCLWKEPGCFLSSQGEGSVYFH